MSCQQCQGIEEMFNDKTAKTDLKNYHKKGPSKITQKLIDALSESGAEGLSLLDIGGGVGAIQHELKRKGVSKITTVDASGAYLEAAKMEAESQGYAEDATYHFGNFVDIAPSLENADIVTLDKVICCFDDMRSLVDSSSKKANKYYAVIFPKDAAWTKMAFGIGNFFLRLFGRQFQTFIHPTSEVDKIVQGNGLQRFFYNPSFFWQIIIYERV